VLEEKVLRILTTYYLIIFQRHIFIFKIYKFEVNENNVNNWNSIKTKLKAKLTFFHTLYSPIELAQIFIKIRIYKSLNYV